MKKIYKSIAAVLASILTIASCTPDLSGIESRLDTLETDMAAVKAQLTTLNAQLAALNKFASGMAINSATNEDGVWVIRLSDGSIIRVTDATTEKTGNAPLLKVDSQGYWMADYGDGQGYVYIYDDNGQKVRAAGKDGQNGTNGQDGQNGTNGTNGQTPVIGVNADGYWTVNGVVINDANGNPVKAVLEAGDSFFNSVEAGNGTITFTLKNGQTVVVPVAPDFLFVVKGADEPVEFVLGETLTFDVESKGIASAMINKPQGWTVTLTEKLLTVTAPATLTKGLVVYDPATTITVLAVSEQGYVVLTGVEIALSDGVNKKSNSAMWEADYDFKSGEYTYNKSIYGQGTLITEDTDIIEPGVYFVADGVHVRWKRGAVTNANVIFIAENAKKSTAQITFENPLYLMSGDLIVKGLTINKAESTSDLVSHYFRDGARVGKIVIDGCNVRNLSIYSGRAQDTAQTCEVEEFILVNNTFYVPSCERIVGYQPSAKLKDFTFDNNLVYSKEMNHKFQVLTVNTLTGTLYARKNTFINVHANSTSFFDPRGTVAGVTPAHISQNLIYIDQLSTRAGIVNEVSYDNVVDNFAWIVSKTSSDWQFLYGWAKWSAVPSFSACPFSAMDFEKEIFTKTAEAENYGAGAGSNSSSADTQTLEPLTLSKDVAAGERIALYENFIRKNTVLSVEYNASAFQPFVLGRGAENLYQSWWIKVTDTAVELYSSDGSSASLKKTYNHGLTLGGKVKAVITEADAAGLLTLTIEDKTFTTSLDGYWGGGAPFFTNNGSQNVNATLSFLPKDAACPVWIIGDSYIDWRYNLRWPYFLFSKGYTKWLGDHLPGGASARLFAAFKNDLQFATPKYAVWTMGMNDGSDKDVIDPTYQQYVNEFLNICKTKGITPVLVTIPSVPSRCHMKKAEWVRNSGYAYIDFEAAVNIPGTQQWQEGYLYSDGVHPDAAGAEALANRFIADFPEISLLK